MKIRVGKSRRRLTLQAKTIRIEAYISARVLPPPPGEEMTINGQRFVVSSFDIKWPASDSRAGEIDITAYAI